MIRTIQKKKEIGAFYTPLEVTRILSEWAIRSQDDHILEPSFGGCGFIEAARERLEELGSRNVASQIFGCDIDRYAFQQLTEKFGLTNISGRFIFADFLSLSPESFSSNEFNVLLGNPPYISHHNMDLLQKQNAYLSLKRSNAKLSAKASLWAYFLIHATAFVKKGGRMAFVLPGSFLNTNYGQEVQHFLRQMFGKVVAILLNDRIFLIEGAEERSVVILCDGKGHSSDHGIVIDYADSVMSLGNIVSTNKFDNNESTLNERASHSLIDSHTKELWDKVLEHPDVTRFGDIADVKIGIVTGDNAYFVVNSACAKENSLTAPMLNPIVTKFKMIKGLFFDNIDMRKQIASGVRCLLVDTTKMRKNSNSLITYLQKYPAESLASNKTFSKRNIWHRPNDGRVPDAFLSYMQHNGPRLALNDVRTTCTNSVHRVFFKNIDEREKKLAAISFLSTITQISAEIEGRSYGSGVLKQEPSEARNVRVCIPSILSNTDTDSLYRDIDNLLRNKGLEAACSEVDKVIYDLMGIGALADTLTSLLVNLRKMRQR